MSRSGSEWVKAVHNYDGVSFLQFTPIERSSSNCLHLVPSSNSHQLGRPGGSCFYVFVPAIALAGSNKVFSLSLFYYREHNNSGRLLGNFFSLTQSFICSRYHCVQLGQDKKRNVATTSQLSLTRSQCLTVGVHNKLCHFVDCLLCHHMQTRKHPSLPD